MRARAHTHASMRAQLFTCLPACLCSCLRPGTQENMYHLRAEPRLLFFHSDVLRATLRAMRAAQFVRTKAVFIFASAPPEERLEANVDEITAGLWAWKRQMEVHFTFYRAEKERAAENALRAQALGRKRGPTAESMFSVPSAMAEAKPLDDTDIVKKALLESAPSQKAFSTADIRLSLSRRRGGAFAKIGAKLPAVVDALAEDRLLINIDESSGKSGPGRNKHVRLLRKIAAEDLSTHDKGNEIRKRLAIELSHFA